MLRSRYFAVLAVVFGLSGVLKAQDPFAPYNGNYGFTEADNVVYGTGAVNGGASTIQLKMDLFQPTDIGVPLLPLSPAILLIHGGSFTGGDRTQFDPLAHVYATHGYTAITIDYRLIGDNLPATAGPAQVANWGSSANAVNVAIQDTETAMDWLRANAGSYHIDTDRIAVGGWSAGAITALMLAYNNPPARYNPTAVISIGGTMSGSQNTIHAGAAPAFVYHGTADAVVPYGESVAVVNRMNAVGVPNFFQTTIGGIHDIDMNAVDSTNGKTMYENSVNFLDTYLLNAPSPPPVPEPSTLVLASIGCVALLAVARRRAARAVECYPPRASGA